MLTKDEHDFLPDLCKSPESQDSPKPDHFHLCYRCERCHRLITKLEILEWRASNGGLGRGNICSCGSGRISATNPTDEEYLRLCTGRQFVRAILGRNDVSTRLWRLRFVVFASPPFETPVQRFLAPLLHRLGVPTILPPPPPPTPEEEEFAQKAKLAVEDAMDARIADTAAKLAADDIPLEEALVRAADEEVGR